MNQYGRRAMEHWTAHAPSRVAAIDDPEVFFTDLGETAASQIHDLTAELERRVPQDLPYQDRVGRMLACRRQAEEIVLHELVYSVTAEPASLMDEALDLVGSLPTPGRVAELIMELEMRARESSERDGRTEVIYTEEEAQELERLQSLQERIVPMERLETMSEDELRDLVLVLGPFRPDTEG